MADERYPISVPINNEDINGTYTINDKDDSITVVYQGRPKKDYLNGLPPHGLAVLLLNELYNEAQRIKHAQAILK